MTIRIEPYNPSQKKIWDSFVRDSKNGTFLFLRDYMDYHRDRFVDNSLLFWNEKNRLIALLPANKEGDTLVSHGGLTYGGVITDARMKTALMLNLFEKLLTYLKRNRFTKVLYKAIPYIYHRLPASEDSYALFRLGAVLYRRDVTTTVEFPLQENLFQQRRLRAFRKAHKSGVTWTLSNDYEQFWPILEHNLWSVHRIKPVHTLDEICRLHAAFPGHIRLFGVFLDDEMIAGTVIYENDIVAHAQYIASSEQGRTNGALDLLFFNLLTEQYKDKKYFDFGISTESAGSFLNTGLVDFKEGFGGRAVTQDFYRIDLT